MNEIDQTQFAQYTFANRYILKNVLGRGGMGEVYNVFDMQLKKNFALKVLKSTEGEQLKRFFKESQAGFSLKHKNIVAIHDTGEEKGMYYIVMELVSGTSLSEELKRGPIERDKTLAILIKIADALDHAHKNNILHRDIKPSNIILDKDNPKIADFGMVKFLGAESSTKTGAILGTILYMSPEQLQGSKNIDGRADLYSLGIMFYEMIAQKLPFSGEQYEIWTKILREKPKFPANFPKDLQKICGKCLEKNPKDRYQSVQEFKKALMQTQRTGSKRKKRQEIRPDTSKKNLAIIAILAVVCILSVASTLIANKDLKKLNTENKKLKAELQKEKKQALKMANEAQKSIEQTQKVVRNLRDQLQQKANKKFKESFQFLEKKTYSCGGQTHTVKEYMHLKTELTFVWIPGKDFLMSKFEVPQKIWNRIMGISPTYLFGFKNERLPVENQLYRHVLEFCNKVGLTLPTEKQWEYACRAGTNFTYYWGDKIDMQYFVTRENSNFITHRPGSKKPNAFGLHDMLGNVWEMCLRSHRDFIALRGGSFVNNPEGSRISDVDELPHGKKAHNIGFRLVFNVSK